MPDFNQNTFFRPLAQVARFQIPRVSVGQISTQTMSDLVRTLINSRPQGKQTSNIAVASSPTQSSWTVTINGVAVTYTGDGSPTQAEVVAGVKAAIQANPQTGGMVDVTSNSSTVICTGRVPGLSFTISGTTDLTVTTPTAAATASAIDFGRACVAVNTWENGSQAAAVASTADLTAQVITLGLAGTAGEIYLINITVDERTYNFSVPFDTDIPTTQAAIVAAINLRVPAFTVLAAGTSPNITLTSELAGKPFTVGVGTKTGTAANLTLTETTVSAVTDFNKAFCGIAQLGNPIEGSLSSTSDQNAGATSWPPNRGFPAIFMAPGGVGVENSQTPTMSSRVYVELAPGSDAGKFYTTSGDTRLLLPANRFAWIGDPDLATDGIGLLKILAAA
jgi:hypothetical protein